MAISMVASALPTSEGKTEDDWSFLQLMQPHLFACLENLDGYLNNEVLDWETSLAVYKLGIVFDDLTLYKFAGTPYTKSLQGLDHAGDEANAVKVRHSLGQNLSWRALYNDSLEYLHPVLRETSTAHYAALYSVGLVYRYQGKYDEALKTLKESHDGYAKVHGEYYSKLLEVKQEIGYVYLCKNEVDTALEWYWPTLAAQENSLGKSHQTTLKTVHGIACAFRRQGKFEETIAWYERALEGREQKLGKEHLQTLATVDGLAETYLAMGRYEEALQGFQRALEGRVKASGNDSMWTLTAVHSVGCALRALCRYPEALEYLERALNGRRKFLGDRHPQTLETVSALFALYPCMEGKERDAEKLRKEYADIS
ncbi:TPR-like protein [Wilcoxina mikolae CBS 423.85]|nr:TPR-like protein [Wilcoxina mikolae CBS 423.85]